MKDLDAFDLDGTLAESKQPLQEPMGEALADLLDVAHVAVISGGDWPQFEKQVASCLPERADRTKLWLMPTTGTKLYRFDDAWRAVYAELFEEDEKQKILTAFDESLEATGFVPEQTWGERIEDRGSQITFSALGQEAPIDAKHSWDPDFAKRNVIQADLRQRLPGLSINMGERPIRMRLPARHSAGRRAWALPAACRQRGGPLRPAPRSRACRPEQPRGPAACPPKPA